MVGVICEVVWKRAIARRARGLFTGPLKQGKKALGVAAQAWRRSLDGARRWECKANAKNAGANYGVIASGGEHRCAG